MSYKILAINLGSTSTKIAVYDDDKLFLTKEFRHDPLEISKFENSILQKDFRTQTILDFISEHNYDLSKIDVFVGRGGLVKPITGGTYIINERMISDLTSNHYGDHVSNLGAIIANDFAKTYNKKAYTVNPVVVDELSDIARVSGFNGIERKSIFHALNHKAVANRYAKSVNKNYKDLNLIVAHMGGGISIALHKKGKVVDVNNALGGDGPFSVERSGALPNSGLIDFWHNNSTLSSEKLKRLLVTNGGLNSYLGRLSGIELAKRIKNGDKKAEFYLDAMLYQVNKNIGALYFANQGKIDAVIFTGGLIYQEYFREKILKLLIKDLNVVFYPGEDELSALAEGVLRVLNGLEIAKVYK